MPLHVTVFYNIIVGKDERSGRFQGQRPLLQRNVNLEYHADGDMVLM